MKPSTTVVFAAALMLPAAAGAQTQWDMPTPYPEGNFHTKNDMAFVEAVEEKTGGDLVITLHPNNTLIAHAEIKNSVRDGIVPIGELLVSRLENENPVYGLDSVPFLATSYDAAWKLYEAQKPALETALEKDGLKLLYSVPWPPQGLYTQKPIKTMADLDGLTFRAYNKGTEAIATKAGMIPTQIEASDVPTAFSTGRVEAMMTSPSTGVDSKAWDFLSHYYDMQGWLPRNMVVVSQSAFDALPEEQQSAVMEAAADAEKAGWEASKAETERTTQLLKDNGIEVAPPSEDLTAGFGKIGEELAEEWKDKAGADGEAILGEFKK
ncbi:TRAP transporter substrate-binding protein [Consotaella aegiceratis]|uniref:TRAP transporter substrate-binding protein n=1 Tax=Consotaella aegiceratis TaxID=3097961 RepID=UPI002F3F625F